jgi:hypothetical protein
MEVLCRTYHLAGRLYQLTPLYDVLSVHPLVEARQIDRQQIPQFTGKYQRVDHDSTSVILVFNTLIL